jgi:hypothetical protein
MNLYNDSTTGSIQIGNNSGYTGGIVINSNAVAPVANTIRIGDTNRPVIMPRVKLTEIDPNVVTIGGVPVSLPVNVNADLLVANGFELYTNIIEPNGTGLNIGSTSGGIINLGTNLSRVDAINIGTNMTSAGNINLGGTLGTTTARKLLVDTLNPVSTLLEVGTTNQRIDIGRVASRTTPIDIGNLGLGDGTTMGSIFIGAGSNSATSSISLGSSSLENSYVRAKTLRLNDGASAVSTIIGNSFAGNTVTVNAPITFNAALKTNSIALVSGTSLTLPNIKTNEIALVSGTSLTLPNILTNSIGLVSGTTLALPAASTTTPVIPDNTTLVPTTAWVNTTITNAINAITGFATYAGTTAFTALQTFNGGVTINSANPFTITASNRAETYNAGGSTTVRRFMGETTGVSASSMSFARYSVSGTTFSSPFKIFSQTNAGGFIFSTQYMEIIVSGILTRSSGGNNFFTTKASFVVSNRFSETTIPSFTYNTQYSSTSQNVFFSTQAPSIYEINLRVEFDTAFVTRQDYYATLITYPSMSTSGVNTNFRISVP